jgi:Spy/CpxP family protein refolding chaperone
MKRFSSPQSGSLLGLGAVLCVTFSLAHAEEGKPKRGPEGGPGAAVPSPAARLRMMSEKLNLSEEQQVKIREIFMKDRTAKKELLSKGCENLSEDEKIKLRDLMKVQREGIESVLTAEQWAKAKEMRDQRSGRPGGAAGKFRRGLNPAHEGNRARVG